MKETRPKQIAYDVQVVLEPWAELRNTKSQHPRATKRASQIPPNPKPPSTRHPSPRSEVTTHCGTTGRPWRRCDHQRRSVPRSRSWKRDERASQPRPQRSAGTPAPGSTRRGPPRRTAGPRCECFPAGSTTPKPRRISYLQVLKATKVSGHRTVNRPNGNHDRGKE